MPKLKAKSTAVKQPVWAGPESSEANGGITQSMISRFLCCRERFRLRVVEGIAEKPSFNHRIEYGQMWHVCEEKFAEKDSWEFALREYCKTLCRKYPLQQEQIVHWMNVCIVQFPLYIAFWKKHDKKSKRTPLLQEQVFHVPYKLPSGRVVWLRGKWDSVDLEGKKEIWLQENKSKGDINEQQLQKQLLFDLQTMFYLIALQQSLGKEVPVPAGSRLTGVRYNVIRRPLSGGKGSIVRHKAKGKTPEETEEAFYNRLAGIIKEQPEIFFMRWKVNVTPSDIEKFKHEFLEPCLEHICMWWESLNGNLPGYASKNIPMSWNWLHYRLPYGIYNVIADGGSTPVDEYLENGSMVGLEARQSLFSELS